ncbi:MAG: TRAP transporter small permease [Clostridiales bacterium]|nr:TRAP transporter small permease [Clostridiales bacterium]
MAGTIKGVKMFTKALMYVTCASTLALLCLTVGNVIMRYVFQTPFSGIMEWSQMFLIISMTCMAHALVEGRFVAVGAFIDRLPKKADFAVEIIMGAVAIAYFTIIGVQLLLQIAPSIQFNELYFVINVPRWPMYLVLGISFLACVPATVVYVIERIKNYVPLSERGILDDNPDLAILALVEGDEEGEAEGGVA